MFARIFLGLGLVFGTAGAAAAQAPSTPVMMVGAELATTCYDAAKETETPGGAEPTVELTGSRIAMSAVEYCTIAIQQGALTPERLSAVHVNRGVLLFAEGAYEAALADFDAAIRHNAASAEAHVNRGFTLIVLKRWAEAIPSLTTGIELQPVKLAQAYYQRGAAHEETGDVRGAYYDYRKAAELSPEWEEPRVQLSRFTVTTRAPAR